MRKLFGCALLLLAGAAVPAQAQVRFGLAGGVITPLGVYGDFDKLGFIAGAGASIPIGTAPVRVRVEGTFSQTSHKDVSGTPVDGNTRIIGGMASLVYSFQAGASLTPYILGGVGFYNVKVEVTGFGSAD
ncbi:MAG: outer membrane beta-barrel protein, partial [Gemmatimonadales bacterium]